MDKTTPEKARKVIEAGGIEAVIGALKNPYQKSTNTIESLLQLLGLLSNFPLEAEQVIEKGGLQAIINLTKEPYEPKNKAKHQLFVKNAFQALNQMCNNNPNALQKVIDAGLVPDMIELLESNKESTSTIEAAIEFFESLARTKVGLDLLHRSPRMMKVFIGCMNANPDNKEFLTVVMPQ
jgi:glutamine synthetase adenylyltransferase